MSAIINSFGTLYEPIKIDEEGNVTLHDPYGYGKRKTGLDGSEAFHAATSGGPKGTTSIFRPEWCFPWRKLPARL